MIDLLPYTVGDGYSRLYYELYSDTAEILIFKNSTPLTTIGNPQNPSNFTSDEISGFSAGDMIRIYYAGNTGYSYAQLVLIVY